MKARIEITNEILLRAMQKDVRELLGLGDCVPIDVAIQVGDADDFIRNVITIALDGPDEHVRPMVTQLMDFIRANE